MPEQNAPSQFQGFAGASRRVQGLLARLGEILAALHAPDRSKRVRETRDIFTSNLFRILVAGEMKRGKSTLINSMLGNRVLPAENLRCTGVVTRLKFGEAKRAVLHHRDGSADRNLDLKDSLTELWDAIRIPEPLDAHPRWGDSDDAAEQASIYSSIEVFYPLPLLRNGVDLVDSPGLNEDPSRTIETLSELGEADAMILVLRCDSPLHETERRFIEKDLKNHSARNIFVVWNRADTLADAPEEMTKLRRFSRQQVERRLPGAQVFFVSARDALRARVDGDQEGWEHSGVPKLERALERFLANERAAAKLRMPLRVAAEEIEHGLLDLIPQRETLIRQPLDSLRTKLEECRPQLVEAEHIRQRILSSVDRCSDAMSREALSSVFSLVVSLQSGAAEHARKYAISKWDMVLRAKKTRERLTSSIEDWISGRLGRWQTQTLPSIVESHVKVLRVQIEQDAKKIFETLDAVKAKFEIRVSVPSVEGGAEISAVERLLGAGLGVIGGVGSMMEGASFGISHMTRGLGVHLLAGAGLIALGVSFPVILPALVLLGTVRSLFKAGSAADELRKAVAQSCDESIRAAVPTLESELRSRLAEMMAGLHATLSERLAVQVSDVRQQVEAVIHDRERVNATTEEQLGILRGFGEELRTLSTAVRELREEIEKECSVRLNVAVDAEGLAEQLVEPVAKGIAPHLKEVIAGAMPESGSTQAQREGIAKDMDAAIVRRNGELLQAIRQPSRATPGEALQGRDREVFKAVRVVILKRCVADFASRCEEVLEEQMLESAKFGSRARSIRPVYRLMVALALSREETSVPIPSRYRELLIADGHLTKDLWAHLSERGTLPSEETFARLYRKAYVKVHGKPERARDVRNSVKNRDPMDT